MPARTLAEAMERQPLSRNARVIPKKHPALKQAKQAFARNSARNSGSLGDQFKSARHRYGAKK